MYYERKIACCYALPTTDTLGVSTSALRLGINATIFKLVL